MRALDAAFWAGVGVMGFYFYGPLGAGLVLMVGPALAALFVSLAEDQP